MLASTNMHTNEPRHTHTHTLKHKHTHTDWPEGMSPYCTVFTNEQSLCERLLL